MEHYSIDTYGLFLTFEDMESLAKIYCKDYSEEAYEEDSTVFNEAVADVINDLQYINNFSGHLYEFDDNGITRWETEFAYYEDELFFVLFDNYSTLMKAAYNSIEEIIDECKCKLENYLPKDFDYRKNMFRIIGTVYN